jgi:hypothetical protein
MPGWHPQKKASDKIRTLKNEGCGTQNPELEFQGLKPPKLQALNVGAKAPTPETREKIPRAPASSFECVGLAEARGALGYKACATKFVNFGICC